MKTSQRPRGILARGARRSSVAGAILVNVGGRNGAGIVAFDLSNGKTLWNATDQLASYSSPIVVRIEGKQRVVFVTRLKCVVIDPQTGNRGCRNAVWKARTDCQRGGAAIVRRQPTLSHRQLWNRRAVRENVPRKIGRPVVGRRRPLEPIQHTRLPRRLSLRHPRAGRRWRGRLALHRTRHQAKCSGNEDQFGVAHALLAGDKMLLLKNDGHLVLARTSSQRFAALATARAFTGTVRAIPALSDGQLYARDEPPFEMLPSGEVIKEAQTAQFAIINPLEFRCLPRTRDIHGPSTPTCLVAQQQFLNVVNRDEAEHRFQAAVDLQPLGAEHVPLEEALGRVLAGDVISPVNVPSFDRSNFDGYAVLAADTFGVDEEHPCTLRLLPQEIATAVWPAVFVAPGMAATIATGGMLPRGADSVVMWNRPMKRTGPYSSASRWCPDSAWRLPEQTSPRRNGALRRHAAHQSRNGRVGRYRRAEVEVIRRPRVAILSTGDEIIAPGQPMQRRWFTTATPACSPTPCGNLVACRRCSASFADDVDQLRNRLRDALASADCVLLSGGTSKGAGDLSYHVVEELDDPGVVAHGVALKPGKPICLASTAGKPVRDPPRFPHVRNLHVPRIRRAGTPPAGWQGGGKRKETFNGGVGSQAEFRDWAHGVCIGESGGGGGEQGAKGQKEGAKEGAKGQRGSGDGLVAYPLGKGSGSVTTFSHADGFIAIDRAHRDCPREIHDSVATAKSSSSACRPGRDRQPLCWARFAACETQQQGWRTKFLAVGSTAGLEAAKRGECDLAGMHLLDDTTGQYNRPF